MLRGYAQAHGWLTRPEAEADRLYLLHHPRHPLRQLAFPMDITVADFDEAVLLAAEKLAELEALPLVELLAQLSRVSANPTGPDRDERTA